MNTITAAITAVGAYVPDFVLSNKVLETMVDTNDEWITTRTGIKERRILKDADKGTSFLAIKAAQDLIAKANIDPLEIDLIIMATATADMPVASTGVFVATEIGATNAFAYDLQAACSSFLYGMSTAAAYVQSGRYKKVLLIGADKMSSIVDYTDRATCIIFGDGAGAVLFEPNYEGLGLQDEYLRSDGVGRDFLKISAGGSLTPTTAETVQNKQHNIIQDGKTVFKYAVTNMADASELILQRNNLTNQDVNWLVPHQANRRIIDATANRMNLEDSKVLVNIEKYGNTTSATLPLVLSDFEHLLKKGDNIIFAAFGGGFTWGSIYLKWAYDKK
ncbi:MULTISPECIES: beta-ketoacyl-ACP synthase III [Flavobacterium]|jgi:3-oxoacyl-[acyl-carrier-protein] synthase-3|uniref:Beta-ketoacyl-[acyl-carrier-protein] synthase III n=2 Tax=Flavobacterium TaxID=237 RepID=A0A1S1JBK5_9FLAO|nr:MULTISPECIES: beta-ketoacyl-ACP synthase III [Flavobacterium]MCC9017440.1 ketoacyl-ACP synthase III [Flavobacterium sp. F-126]MDL2143837.1 beta-ketoacyl-ACP synthase III [Flavobacterium tructae]OHT46825.1 3-oxoacyl-ACP synthase [Flavobacterium tructae]OXB21133.1 ketoacyl-ACP synthase III [Flavobacterium tructae]OXB23545.1 ketoacyl-ACP synthase III [Flavobacterium tructae]|eukprot:TRINITY_DN7391_c0_g9_i2.p2 TRINITY_DN7391_c0_g9~~TRINITY_DN7391_c0_g9_i2.p2  ORF type:complete len:333 (+),score=-56.69 TRINITY_DN7391_c0_g9_i2:98-1096(+)